MLGALLYFVGLGARDCSVSTSVCVCERETLIALHSCHLLLQVMGMGTATEHRLMGVSLISRVNV